MVRIPTERGIARGQSRQIDGGTSVLRTRRLRRWAGLDREPAGVSLDAARSSHLGGAAAAAVARLRSVQRQDTTGRPRLRDTLPLAADLYQQGDCLGLLTDERVTCAVIDASRTASPFMANGCDRLLRLVRSELVRTEVAALVAHSDAVLLPSPWCALARVVTSLGDGPSTIVATPHGNSIADPATLAGRFIALRSSTPQVIGATLARCRRANPNGDLTLLAACEDAAATGRDGAARLAALAKRHGARLCLDITSELERKLYGPDHSCALADVFELADVAIARLDLLLPTRAVLVASSVPKINDALWTSSIGSDGPPAGAQCEGAALQTSLGILLGPLGRARKSQLRDNMQRVRQRFRAAGYAPVTPTCCVVEVDLGPLSEFEQQSHRALIPDDILHDAGACLALSNDRNRLILLVLVRYATSLTAIKHLADHVEALAELGLSIRPPFSHQGRATAARRQPPDAPPVAQV